MNTKIREVKAKSIITKCNLPDAEFVINPYVGCTHACNYCYAVFMKRFTGHLEPWGKFLDIKINAAELIPTTKKYEGKSIFLSSVTDPYVAPEKRYLLTRRIIEKLIPLKPKLCVQTKSSLVLRDLDLLKKFEHVQVGMTITTLDDDFRKEVEPNTSPVQERIETLKTLKENGIETYVFIGPIFPFLTDWKAVAKAVSPHVEYMMFENLNVQGAIWGSIQKWLKEKRPELLEKYKEIYFTQNDYWTKVEREIELFCKEKGIKYGIFFHHGQEKEMKGNSPLQQ